MMWTRTTGLGIALALAFGAAGSQAAPMASGTAAAAVGDAGRSADNRKLDESRKPAEVLAFMGIQPGMQVADMFGGNHYWAELFAPAVGPRGHVTVWEPDQFYSDKTKAGFAAFAAAHPNVSILTSPFGAPNLPVAAFDRMMLNLNYHDVYWTNAKLGITTMDPNAWLKTIYAAMKPGGVVAVIDHVGPAGDTRAIVDKTHRIDPATVRADFQRAGFVLDGESSVLRNPADDHSLPVFDAAIRGKTDRVFYRFKKPR